MTLVRRLPFVPAAIDGLKVLWARPDIGIFHHFESGPYGGANQFLVALRGEFARRGLRVAANLIGPNTRGALLNAYAFDEKALSRMRRPGCRIVHRVDGPIGRYRGSDDEIDRRVEAINRRHASATIFQSRYSLSEHQNMGLSFVAPVVIPNAPDPAIFHPSRTARRAAGKIRLIASSWSDNPNKGASLYQWLDKHLDWARFDFTFVGRTPVAFERIRVLPPLRSTQLAEELRAHDIYVTASRNDPASNALLEGLACGLPALALRSGGHPEIVGDGGVFFEGPHDVLDALAELAQNLDQRRAAILVPDLSIVATRYLELLSPDSGV